VLYDGYAEGEFGARYPLGAPYEYLRAIEFVGELPKTQTGKVNRAALRALG